MVDFILRQTVALMQPVGLLWLALIFLSIALFRKKERRLAWFTATLVIAITVCGSTDFSGWLLRRLEKPCCHRQ